MTIRKVLMGSCVLLLAACSRHAAPDTREGAPVDAVRLAMPDSEPMPGPRLPGAKAVWAGAPDGSFARLGYPGQGPDLSIACRSGVLLVTRHVPAEVGAQALFALQGRGRILRLPVDATSVDGQRGYIWQGTIAADDPGTEVFDGAFNGTLPDAGKIEAPASDALRTVIARCRTRPATTAPIEAATAEAVSGE